MNCFKNIYYCFMLPQGMQICFFYRLSVKYYNKNSFHNTIQYRIAIHLIWAKPFPNHIPYHLFVYVTVLLMELLIQLNIAYIQRECMIMRTFIMKISAKGQQKMMIDSKERRLLTIKVSNTTPYCVTQIIERLVMLISKIPYDTVSICNAYLRVSA